MSPADPARCPCGTGLALERCCGPVVRDERPAATAEALMRSRYSAYVLGDEAHLRRSWAAATRPARVSLDPAITWTGLVVEATTGGTLLDREGTVTFVAHHRTGGRDGWVRETSRFVREEGRWVYVGPS